jgi:hypothetical protein
MANLARALYSLVRRGLLGHKVQPVLRVHLGRKVQLAQSVHKAVPGHKVQQEQWGRQARKDRKV